MKADGRLQREPGAPLKADVDVRYPLVPQRSDADIAVAVAHALRLSACLPGNSVHGAVNNGHVTLWGEVDLEHERDAATAVTRWLTGVTGVTNLTRVTLRDRPEDAPRRLNSITRLRARLGQARTGKA